MKKILFILLFYSLTNSSFAQYDMYRYIVQEDDVTTGSKRFYSTNDYLPDEVIGSPYSDETFQSGIVYENNESVIKGVFFRYNAYKDNIEVKKKLEDPDSEIFILVKNSDIVIKLQDQFLIYDDDINGYYQILFVGNNYKLIKKLYKRYYKPRRAKTSFEKSILATYKDDPKYFLVSSDGEFHEFPASKNKKLKFFGNKKTEIEKYIKNNDLDINDEEVLIKIVRYYDSFNDSILK